MPQVRPRGGGGGGEPVQLAVAPQFLASVMLPRGEPQWLSAKRQRSMMWRLPSVKPIHLETRGDELFSHPEPERLSSVQIVLVVSFYFITSISLVFLNKILLSGYDFPYPLFLFMVHSFSPHSSSCEMTMFMRVSPRYQLVVALILLVILGFLGQQYAPSSVLIPRGRRFPTLSYFGHWSSISKSRRKFFR